MTDRDEPQRWSRRAFLAAGGTAAAATAAARWWPERNEPSAPPGPTQRGVDRPATPPASLQVLVLRATRALPDRASLHDLLADLGGAARRAQGGVDTVQVGIGPRLLTLIDPDLPGATPMPPFRGDEHLAAERLEADVVLLAADAAAGACRTAAHAVAEAADGFAVAWSQAGSRPAGDLPEMTVNPLGFADGLIVPTSTRQLEAGVWIGDGSAAGGTIGVLRRFRLDVDRFTALPDEEQARVIGRTAAGTPLSGGRPGDEVDLRAKTPSGDLLVPARSHVRAAHPSFTGSPLMLRRSYGFDDGVDGDGHPDRGTLFLSYQSELRTFVRTQQRLDEVDDLMGFATPTARASFLVLPGSDGRRPLGAALFAR